MQVVIVPAVIGCAGDKPATAIIGYKHAVVFEGGQDDLVRVRERRDVHISLEAQTQAHRWQVWIRA